MSKPRASDHPVCPQIHAATQWPTVSKSEPCRLCGRRDRCKRSSDGGAHLCFRPDIAKALPGHNCQKRVGESGTPYMMCVLEDSQGWVSAATRRANGLHSASVSSAPGPVFNGEVWQVQFVAALSSEALGDLASSLGVSCQSLSNLGFGWANGADLEAVGAWGKGWTTEDRRAGAFSCPERNDSGSIIGFSFRLLDGRKGCPKGRVTGAQRGLAIPWDLGTLPDPVLIVEGVSDVAACLTAHITAVGRPNNATGAAFLDGLLRGREVLVVGENDEKDDGHWPGLDGAQSIAADLSCRWAKPVRWAMPPGRTKDLRQWLGQQAATGLDLTDKEACRAAGSRLISVLRDGSKEYTVTALVTTDSIPAPTERDLAGNEWGNPVPITELGASNPTPWVWKGFLARGYASLLFAHAKAGKTTLLSHLLGGLRHGTALGCTASNGRILVASEEGPGLWRQRREDLKLAANVELFMRPFGTKPSLSDWERWAAHVQRLTIQNAYELVVIDTLANLWPVNDENDAGQVTSSLMPLTGVIKAGAALLLIHHARKSGGGEGLASRGSSALLSWPDIVVELRRQRPEDDHDPRRLLKAWGRFDEIPPETVVELADGTYRIIGDAAEISEGARLKIIENLLPDPPRGLTAEEVLERWPGQMKPGLRTIRDDLKAGVRKALWIQTGKGVRGCPHCYHRGTGFDSGTAPLLTAGIESELDRTPETDECRGGS